MRLTLTNTKNGKVTYAVVRVLAHDPKPVVGGKGAKFGWPNTVITAGGSEAGVVVVGLAWVAGAGVAR